ncbi:hypothetical protein [Flavobacterium tructae]|uniref:SRPBCC family protein n=1 Tax=Flavobacterium tructae TaxID=1114873 RepID=A0A1S1JA00_9FLAO|nr:hypothetical protein [Flavobacterium tructae]OHT46600.1 hypothetical protein BHE19_03590 [Flavobacterium tructae]OXB20912.1 hypothetical protein B0A71_04770 [Flavobacterium tructae]
MIHLLTDIEVKKNKALIYEFLLNLDKEKYCQWHPAHKEFAVIKRTEKELGSILYFKEIVDETTVNYKWRIIELTENKLIKMKALYFYPIYLTIALESISQNKTIVHHYLEIGYSIKFLNLIIDWAVGHSLFSLKKRKSQQLHAIEEYTNLENLLN